MESLEHHTHTRLQSPRSIRIIKLFPSVTQNAPIRCRLTELSVDKYVSHDYKTPGPYEALSYVWGSKNGSIPIECDGKALLLTENCHSALVRLRGRLWSRALWIDSIRIDQDEIKPSEEERIVQIQLMGEVYRIASCVIVWLGQCSVSTKQTLLILRAAAILQLPSDPSFGWKNTILWKFRDKLEVQESGINGNFIPAIDSRETLRALINSQSDKPSLMMRCIKLSQNKLSDSTPQSTELQYSSPESFNAEMSLLSSALEHDATVPHDKLFSMYPLLRFRNLDLPEMSYDKPFGMLCEELTRCWFHSKKNLNIILLAARLPGNDSRLPSWVPDWGNRQSALDYRLKIHKSDSERVRGKFYKRNRASNGSSLDDFPKTITGKLHLRGLSLGIISRALFCDIPDDPSAEQSILEVFRVFRTWCCAVEASSIYSTRPEFWNALHFTTNAHSPDHYNENLRLNVVFRLLYDLMLYPDCLIFEPAQAKKTHELFLEVERGGDISHVKPLKELFGEIFGELVNLLRNFWVENRIPNLNQSSNLPSELSMARVSDYIHFSVIAFSMQIYYLKNQSLFLLDDSCGLAAYTVREGDEIYLLKGLDVPVVLRPSGENYSFVGSCLYIHEVMEGQKWPKDESELQDIVLI